MIIDPNTEIFKLIEKFDKTYIPSVRRFFPSLIAKELVSVQPIKSDILPVLIEALRKKEILEREFFKEEEFRI